jgi:cytosine/adenosine deaminase-related metal-dependent hydrolase
MRSWIFVLIAIAACGAPAPAVAPAAGASGPEVARHYDVVFGGRVVGRGELVVDGAVRRSHYEYDDRGRGPSLDAEVTVSERGLPRAVAIRGVNYLKVAVTETLVASGGALTWTGTDDRGTSRVDGGFYLPAEDMLDDLAMLARALRQAPDRRLALLPAGEAVLEADTTHHVEVAGVRRRLSSVAIAGLGFAPQRIWLDEDGELFGWASTWFSVVPRGAAGAIPALLAIDDAADAARAATLAERLAHQPPAAGLALVNARVFDPASGTARDDQTILVVGDRIAAVGPARTVAVPAGAEVLDVRGGTVLPGLWDMHVHLGTGALHLAAGVTTVRDLGNDLDEVAALIGRFEGGTEIGPRVIRAGLVDGPGPYAGPTKLLVDTADEARAVVDLLADRGFASVKLYSSLAPALVPAFIEAARRRGLRVHGHIPFGMTARQAVEAGFDELNHVNFLFLNFLAGPDDDTRTPARFRLLARAPEVALASPEVAAFVELLRQRRTVVDPTLTAFEEMLTVRPGQLEPGIAAVADRLPPTVQRMHRGGGLAASAEEQATYEAAFPHLLAMVKLLYDRGVTLVAGTDGLAGFTLHHELELYVKAGIPAPAVLRIATLGAATVAGMDRELGSVVAGKRADLYVVQGDPLADIAALRRGVAVISRGRRFVPAEVYASLGVQPAR